MTQQSRKQRICFWLWLILILAVGLAFAVVAHSQARYPSTVREICAAHHVKYDKHTHGCYIGKDLPNKDGGRK